MRTTPPTAHPECWVTFLTSSLLGCHPQDWRGPAVKKFSVENNLLPVWYEGGWDAESGSFRGEARYDLPEELTGLSLAERLLISRLHPAISLQHLHHGGIASKGHVATFPRPVQQVANILPWLPESVEIIRFKRRTDNEPDRSRAYNVRHQAVRDALRWLKKHNKFYQDVVIDDQERWRAFQERQPDGQEIAGIQVVETGAQQDNDHGPAPHQHTTVVEEGAGDVEWCETAGMLLPAGVPLNVRSELERLLRDGAPAAGTRDGAPAARTAHLDWPVAGSTPVSEYTTRGFFSMSFPWLFPSGCGDFFDDRPRPVHLHEWAEHLLYYQDGRFAMDVAFPFITLNMVYRRRAREQATWLNKGQLDDPPVSVGDLQERVRAGADPSALLEKLVWLGGTKLRGTDAYWSSQKTEVEAWVDYHVQQGNGVPTLFVTGSCAEFQWRPLLDLIEEMIYDSTGEVVDLRTNFSRAYTAVNEYAVIVVQFFQLRMEAYCETILKEQLGIHHYWFRYEFAKSRGQIHWHLFGIRGDREPSLRLHQAKQELGAAVEGGGMTQADADQELARRLASWCHDALELTATHPATSSDGHLDLSRVRSPHGTWEPPADRSSAIQHTFGQCSSEQDDHIDACNHVCHHVCNDYCLGKLTYRDAADAAEDEDAPAGGRPHAVIAADGTRRVPVRRSCRMEAGTEATAGKCDTPGWALQTDPSIDVDEKRGFKRIRCVRNTPRLQQHSRPHLQSWRGNGDVTVIVIESHPDNPEPSEIAAVLAYVVGYGCKGVETMQVYPACCFIFE